MDDQPLTRSVDFRFTALTKELDDVKKRLDMYVPQRENDLQIKMIHETVERTERQLADLSEKILAQELDLQRREASAQRRQSNLQIKILWGTVSTIIGLMVSVLVGYITHLFR